MSWLPRLRAKLQGPQGLETAVGQRPSLKQVGFVLKSTACNLGWTLLSHGSLGHEAVQDGLALCVSEERMLPGLPVNITSANILLDKEFRPRVESVAHLFDSGSGHKRT